jgi:hypothetical protein
MMVHVLADVGLFLAIASFLVAADLLLRSYVIWLTYSLVALGCRASSRGIYYGGRMLSRGVYHGALLGCIRYGRRVYALADDLVLVLPPCAGKAGLVADRILSDPGPAPATSTRPDLTELSEEGGAS